MFDFHFTLQSFPGLVTGTLVLLLASAVLLRQRGVAPARNFALVLFLIAGWLFSFSAMYASTLREAQVAWARTGFLLITPIAAAIYHFSVALLKRTERRFFPLLFCWLTTLGFIAAALGGDLLISGVQQHSWGPYPLFGQLAPVYVSWFAALLLLNLFEYLIELDANTTPSRRAKLMKLVIAFSLAYGSFVDFLPMFGVPLYPIGFAFLLAYFFYAFNSIVYYRLQPINPSFAANEIIETMADALIVCDRNGRIKVVNHAVTSLFGYRPEELAGRSLDLLVTDHDATLANTDKLRRVLVHGTVRDHERTFRSKDGQLIDVAISMSPLRVGGEQIGSVITARDIRDRKQTAAKLKHGASLLSSTLESTADGVLVINREKRIVLYNQRFVQMWGVPHHILGTADDQRALDYVLDQVKDPDEFLRTVNRLYEKPEAESYDVIEFKDGRIFERHSIPQRVDGAIQGRVWSFRDVTERRRAESALRASERRYRQLFERNLAGVYRNSLDGVILDCNDSFARIFGYEMRSEVIGRNAGEMFFNQYERDAVIDMLTQVKNISGVELCLKKKDGSRVWVLENASLVESEGEAPFMEGTLVDISGLKVAEEQMEFQAYHDVLTCLPNRKLFIDRLALAAAQSRRTGQPLAVMFLDIDHFKVINDTLGHTAGDELLLCVADRLSRCLREGDTVARIGGDEFTILVSTMKESDDAAKVAEQVLEAIEEPIMLGDRQLFVTASIGIAISPTDGTDAETLLKNADSALYRAKDAGRNNYQLCTEEMKVRALERLSLEGSLRRALERNELVLHYQPVINLLTGRVSGLEALLRWNHPERGLTGPDSFIPLAESSRLIVPIGEWVLRTACEQAKKWRDSGLNGFRMAVNLSARQFQQRDLSRSVETILEQAGLSPHHLELEITESTAMANVDLTVDTLHVLREMGMHIAIDDFGTGYSSLNYLKRFPINTVKIDKSFVRDVENDPSGAAIVSAVIGLARVLKLRVIAEGVETEQQLRFLYRRECEEMQGYYFSHPLSAEEITPFLEGVRDFGGITSMKSLAN
jgi:diguanylate cyclase (GGDEF)-like protein/PAS domain S-box-containing protein